MASKTYQIYEGGKIKGVALNLDPMTASGDIIYGGTSGAPTALAKGTNGHVLTLFFIS